MNDNSSPTINNWLREATAQLTQAGIATAELDAWVLLEDCLNKDRAHLMAHPEIKLTSPQLKTLLQQLKKRIQHEPLAYIRGKTEFYGREFEVNNAVLEPRPETETMIDLLKDLPSQSATVADIGTGSGAIAITAKLELPSHAVLATDNDKKCLDVAKKNVQKHSANVRFYEGDLLQPILDDKQYPDILLCNLPYVPNDFGINKAALHEPHNAIFGGSDGLDLYRKLFEQIDSITHKPKYVFTESLPFQHESLVSIATEHGYKLLKSDDFIQLFATNS